MMHERGEREGRVREIITVAIEADVNHGEIARVEGGIRRRRLGKKREGRGRRKGAFIACRKTLVGLGPLES